ncbi:MAG: hypothetical protein HC911_08095 [Chloroflexaceae bacterium]|nr:hypothetical protein [Chloroflexaceae bacterium]
MIQHIGRATVATLAGGSAIACFGSAVAVWRIRSHADQVGASLLSLLNEYLPLASSGLAQIETVLIEVQPELSHATVEQMEARATRLIARMQGAIGFGRQLSTSITAINATLEQVNRSLPFGSIPTISHELAELEQHLQTITTQLGELHSLAAQAELTNHNGEAQVAALVECINGQITLAQPHVAATQLAIATVIAQIPLMEGNFTAWTGTAATVWTGMAMLLGAGQVSLLRQSMHWLTGA